MSQPTIRRGSKGASVRLCQERLTAHGLKVKIDGDFGPATDTAVHQFQAAYNLDTDGVVGSITWAYLMSLGQAPTPAQVIQEQRAALASYILQSSPQAVQAVLLTAIEKVGCKEVPDGSNGGSEIAEVVEGPGGDGRPPSAYYLYHKVTDKTVLQTMPPWCCLFVCYALRVGLGKTSWSDIPFGNWLGGCSQVEAWAQKNGRWTTPAPASVPQGALFTISRGDSGSDASSSARAGHIGFVLHDNGDGTVLTVEGNVSNAVGSHRRKKASLRGIITWW